MSTSKSLQELYQLIKSNSGPIEAKNYLSTTIYNIISEIHEEGLEVSEELIQKKLEKEISDFSFAAKSAA